MFDWDDLRVFLAAARSGSFGAAAQRLSLDTTTVGRRVARLETALRATLVSRSPTGLQLTATGAELMEIALSVETTMSAAARSAERSVVAGTVRISTSEGFGAAVVAPALPDLARQRPGLRIELAAYAGFLSTTRREVDMAITLSAPAARRLIVEPLTSYQLALYASPGFAAAGLPASRGALSDYPVVGYIDDLLYAPELRYLDEVMPGLSPTLASSSIQAQVAMVAAGAGIGVLPCFLATGLTRVLPGEVLLERRFWLSTARELHDTARMRAVQAWLRSLVRQRQEALQPYPSTR